MSCSETTMTTRKKISEAETNLRVAVRVRPMNATERNEKCTNIVKVDSVKRTLALKGKHFGPFFRTFDSHTTQMEIYDDLVSSQIKKVIAGFNCTVFAYGQTGTGKTFTMEGGRSDAKSCHDDPTTGIVPRAVEDIFEQLESSGCEEFSLRVSYVELYNEELIDLLASSGCEDRERLRIFDDPNKKGVIVSGVEEVPVRNRCDVFKLLALGAEKRKTAATLMNMNSSRSHSLFMVNVVVRENTSSGEELVKQGKLNLVDLAGSENIGRSGAQGSRAKEAGSINQSLLTLGRVIRSLTTNAQHIPYRESKLTRLLQDSLGGTTITSLIATISPSSSNFEESQSTLEYAVRAANIKNKPVCNTKVSKKTILKEYSDEIEKLRRDLRAAREKNGVIISEESHEEFQRNAEKVLELEQQLDNEVDRLKRFTEDLMHMDEQYKEIYKRKEELEDRLRERLREMAEKEKELADTKDELNTYMQALGVMHTAALKSFEQLVTSRNAAENMENDLHAFWRKVDDMKQTDNRNKDKVIEFVNSMNEFIAKMGEQTDLMTQSGLRSADNVVSGANKISESLESTSRDIASNSGELKDTIGQYFKRLTHTDLETSSKICELSEKIKLEWIANIRQCHQFYDQVTKVSKDGSSLLHSRLEEVKREIASFSEDVRPLLTEIRGAICDNVTARQEKSARIVEDVRSTSATLAEQMKSMMEQMNKQIVLLEELPSRVEREHDALALMDQTVQESVLDVLATADTDLIALGDEVDGICDVEEETKRMEQEIESCTELFAGAVKMGVEASANQTEKVRESIKEFVQEADRNRNNVNDTFASLIKNCASNGDKCKASSAEIDAFGKETSSALQALVGDIKKTSGSAIGDAREAVDKLHLERVDPYENAPARSTPKFPAQNELVTPPEPEVLISSEESGENDFSESPDVRARKKRRVTTYVRRDSLLDSTNVFMSPNAIIKKRELDIEEEFEDVEN